MERVEKFYYHREKLSVSNEPAVQSNSSLGKDPPESPVVEKARRIVELEKLLHLKDREIWHLKALYRRALGSEENHTQDLQPDQLFYPGGDKNPTDSSPGFQHYMVRLKRSFPSLTSNDLRICSLLRQNLSTKEVARYLGIGPESANKARYRIRKKLGLSKGEDLVYFLLEF